MKRWIYILLVLAATLPMGSCRRAVEKARRNIRIEAVESVERRGLTGVEVVLRVMNNTGYKLALEQASLDLFYGRSRIGKILLREGVQVQRRTTGSVATAWQIKISDPLALYVLTRKLHEGDISQISVSYAVTGRGGPAPVNISREMVPLSEILNIFGLSLQDLTNYLKE
ncbi:MAG: hypothetical protein RR410_00830 [Alistipes sp.]